MKYDHTFHISLFDVNQSKKRLSTSVSRLTNRGARPLFGMTIGFDIVRWVIVEAAGRKIKFFVRRAYVVNGIVESWVLTPGKRSRELHPGCDGFVMFIENDMYL